MPDFKKMTVERLRELARKVLGPGHSRLKTKGDLVRALEEAEEPVAAAPRTPRPTRAAGATAEATRKAVRAAKGAAKDAGKAAREGARQVARAGKAAAGAAAEGARAGTKVARERKGGKLAAAAAAAAGAVAGVAAAAKRRGGPPEGGPDPEGYFVARVRGEEAAREAPHPMCESGTDRPQPLEEGVGPPAWDEGLGELPPGYGDDAFVALPRDPRTLFVYWDLSHDTRAQAFAGLEGARAQLWVFARAGEGWERHRVADFALESRGFYVHDLEPGRTYRAEIHALDRHGTDRLVGRSSNEVTLPRVGPSSLVDDRFIRIPWDMPLGRLLGPGHAGAPFSEEARALLARLSDWSRFSGPTWGSGSAGGKGAPPSSPTSSRSTPSGHGGGER